MAERELPCCDHCYYCDAPLVRRHEHDHFPTPKSRGGKEVVPACMNCHDMKDRMPVDQWSPTFFVAGLQELLGKSINVAMSPQALLAFVGDYRMRWPRLSHAGRLVYAKTRAMVELSKPKPQDAQERPATESQQPELQDTLF